MDLKGSLACVAVFVTLGCAAAPADSPFQPPTPAASLGLEQPSCFWIPTGDVVSALLLEPSSEGGETVVEARAEISAESFVQLVLFSLDSGGATWVASSGGAHAGGARLGVSTSAARALLVVSTSTSAPGCLMAQRAKTLQDEIRATDAHANWTMTAPAEISFYQEETAGTAGALRVSSRGVNVSGTPRVAGAPGYAGQFQVRSDHRSAADFDFGTVLVTGGAAAGNVQPTWTLEGKSQTTRLAFASADNGMVAELVAAGSGAPSALQLDLSGGDTFPLLEFVHVSAHLGLADHNAPVEPIFLQNGVPLPTDATNGMDTCQPEEAMRSWENGEPCDLESL